jgi:hypothetical protein
MRGLRVGVSKPRLRQLHVMTRSERVNRPGGLVLGPGKLRGPAKGERAAVMWWSGLAGHCLAGLARCHGPKGPFPLLCFIPRIFLLI